MPEVPCKHVLLTGLDDWENMLWVSRSRGGGLGHGGKGRLLNGQGHHKQEAILFLAFAYVYV